MTNPLDRLRQVKDRAEYGSQAGALYKRFVAHAQAHLGWTASDVEEYREQITKLMRGSPEEALALYPSGHYKTAVEARDANIEYWRSTVASFSG